MECSEPPSPSLPQCKIISSNWYLKPWTAFASGYAIEIAVYTLTTCTCSLLSVKQGQVRVFCYSNKKLTGLQKSNFSIFGRHQTEFARCQQNLLNLSNPQKMIPPCFSTYLRVTNVHEPSPQPTVCRSPSSTLGTMLNACCYLKRKKQIEAAVGPCFKNSKMMILLNYGGWRNQVNDMRHMTHVTQKPFCLFSSFLQTNVTTFTTNQREKIYWRQLVFQTSLPSAEKSME